jgi:hypothetical protein
MQQAIKDRDKAKAVIDGANKKLKTKHSLRLSRLLRKQTANMI